MKNNNIKLKKIPKSHNFKYLKCISPFESTGNKRYSCKISLRSFLIGLLEYGHIVTFRVFYDLLLNGASDQKRVNHLFCWANEVAYKILSLNLLSEAPLRLEMQKTPRKFKNNLKPPKRGWKKISPQTCYIFLYIMHVFT